MYQKCTNMYAICTKLKTNVHQIIKNVQKCTKVDKQIINKNVQKYTQMYKNVQAYTQKKKQKKCTNKYTKMYKKCTNIYKNVHCCMILIIHTSIY